MSARHWIGPAIFAVASFFATRTIIRGDGETKPKTTDGRRVGSTPASHTLQKGTAHRHAPAKTPEARLLPPLLTFRQKTLKDYGHQGVSTWSAIDQAESSLSQTIVKAMVLSDSPFLPIDCFEEGEDWSEFSYSLAVTSTKQSVTVGGFRVENSPMPNRVSQCLEEVFSGESTIESVHKEDEQVGFLEFETRLERSNTLVRGMMFATRTRGREKYLSALEDIFNEHQSREEKKQKLRNLYGPDTTHLAGRTLSCDNQGSESFNRQRKHRRQLALRRAGEPLATVWARERRCRLRASCRRSC